MKMKETESQEAGTMIREVGTVESSDEVMDGSKIDASDLSLLNCENRTLWNTQE